MKRLVAFVTLAIMSLHASLAMGAFTLDDKAGDHLDILLDGKIVARYMYAFDKSTPARLNETYKPYLHVFDAEGKAPITKGAGGNFTHHRGIFIGWNKIAFNGKSYDRWHMVGGQTVHQKFLEKKAGDDEATIISLTHWNDEAGKPIIEEERTMTVRRAAAPARVVIDFTSKMKTPNGEVVLDGDPEHAGIHYRPADEIVAAETLYAFPKDQPNAHKDLDYPWVGETYTLAGKQYSVVEFNHPGNPKGTKYSAYRDYGRFGAFFTAKIPAGEALTVKYRFLIADGQLPAAELIQKCGDEFGGAAAATAAPKITVVPAEKPAPPAPKKPAPAKPAAK